MTVLFIPDIVAPHDAAGFGRWRSGHYLEHRQFISLARAATPTVSIPDYDIHAWSDDPGVAVSWLNAHYQIHQALRAQSGVTGIDLSQVDFTKDNDFVEWQDDHRQEHQALRQFYGVT